MIDAAEFLAAIRANPDDNTSRLVYADWLDEQGRPGGEFLRIDCAIADLDPAEFERREQERAQRREAGEIDSAPPDLLDTFYWQRAHLVARLRVAALGLEDDWMAAVSRVPLDEINARNREIQSWLRHQVAVAEASGALRWEDTLGPRTGLWQFVRRLFTRGRQRPGGLRIEPDRNWATEHMQPGDELWEYNTAGDSWAHLCGEMGYAIVRKGRVVDFQMLLMN